MKDARWFRLLILALAATLVFAACGGDDEGGGEDNGSTEQVAVGDYVADFCNAMVDWQGSIQSLSTEYRENVTLADIPPEEKKENLATYFEDIKAATEDFISDVESAGSPDVEGGGEVADQFLSGFRELTGAIEDVQGQIDGIPAGSLQAFNAAAEQLVGQMQTSFQTIGDNLTQIESQPIDQAFNDEPACSQIQTAP